MSTGYETIGDALTWTLFLLAGHPEAEAAVLTKIESVLGSNLPTLETIGGGYLECRPLPGDSPAAPFLRA